MKSSYTYHLLVLLIFVSIQAHAEEDGSEPLTRKNYRRKAARQAREAVGRGTLRADRQKKAERQLRRIGRIQTKKTKTSAAEKRRKAREDNAFTKGSRLRTRWAKEDEIDGMVSRGEISKREGRVRKRTIKKLARKDMKSIRKSSRIDQLDSNDPKAKRKKLRLEKKRKRDLDRAMKAKSRLEKREARESARQEIESKVRSGDLTRKEARELKKAARKERGGSRLSRLFKKKPKVDEEAQDEGPAKAKKGFLGGIFKKKSKKDGDGSDKSKKEFLGGIFKKKPKEDSNGSDKPKKGILGGVFKKKPKEDSNGSDKPKKGILGGV
ncbi:MAG: hypothetical protein HOE90_12090, partial [Bacteriovoracaceae bacterium]|nr:hypothetical protein [Bacteriovoracaceae bacterium]